MIGVRLGLDGVNPIYYDTIKVRAYLQPSLCELTLLHCCHYSSCTRSHNQSASQEADPVLRTISSAPRPITYSILIYTMHALRSLFVLPHPYLSHSGKPRPNQIGRPDRETNTLLHHTTSASPSSSHTGSLTFSYHAPISPPPLQQEFSPSSSTTGSFSSPHRASPRASRSLPPSQQPHSRWQLASQSQPSSEMMDRELTGLDPV